MTSTPTGSRLTGVGRPRPRVPALTAALLFAATAAIDIPHDQGQPFVSALDYLLEGVFAAALICAAGALWGMSQVTDRRAARIAWIVPALGNALVGAAASATLLAGRDVLGPMFAAGLLLVIVGYAAVAVLDLRRRVIPRFAGVSLLAGTVAMLVLGEGTGTLAWSAAWFAVAALLQPATLPAGQPTSAA